MSRPQLEITKNITALGQAGTSDGVPLLILNGTGTNKSYLNLAQAEADGITQAAGTTNNTLHWQILSDYFQIAGDGAKIHVFFLDQATNTLTQLFTAGSVANTALRNYLASQNGEISLLGVMDFGGIVDAAGMAAILPLMDAFADAEFSRLRPLHILFAPSQYCNIGLANLQDLATLTAGTASVVIARNAATRAALNTAGNTAYIHYTGLGTLLGRLAAIHVGRNIGRVADGALPGLNNVEFAAGTDTAGTFSGQLVPYQQADEATLDSIAAKRYIFFDKYPGRTGWFFSDDPTATASNTSDAFISFNRCLNKAAAIAVATYLNSLKDEILVDDDGRLAPITVQGLQNSLQSAIEANMVSNPDPTRPQEISSASVIIDPAQNVLATSKIVAQLSIVPLGTARVIETQISLSNPANS